MSWLSSYLYLILGFTGLLVLALVVYLVRLISQARARRAEQKEAPADEGEAAPKPEKREAETTDLRLRNSFARGFEKLKSQSTRRDFRYQTPWFLLFGQGGSRPRDLLANAGLSFPIGRPEEHELESELGLRWWFFNRGIVLDLAGEYVLRADGETADDRGWRTFLRLLLRYRPERPLDGIVLTLSCEELLAAARAGAPGAVEIEHKAERLYSRLWSLQKTLGLRFPVYLLVTGCEALRGFGAFRRALPDRSAHEMLGWSNPYRLDTGYRPEWTDEALDGLKRSLEQAQLELYGGLSEVRHADEVFLFPAELRSLKEPLRVYLSQLFRPISYHESLVFRGLYFCGSEKAPEAPAETGAEGAAAPEQPLAEEAPEGPAFTYFLRDLLEEKVFVETNLAGPTGATLVQKNRRVRLAQAGLVVLAIVLTLGTWSALRTLGRSEKGLNDFLVKTHEELKAGAQEQVAGQVAATSFLRRLALDARRVRKFFIPRSWIPDLDDRLRASFVKGYDVLVFQAMNDRLDERALAISRRADREEAGYAVRLGAPAVELSVTKPIAEMPAFQRLKRHVEQLVELEEKARLYNGLRQTKSLEDLGDLVEYLFSEPLPEEFFTSATLYEEALEEVDYEEFDIRPYREYAIRSTLDLADEFYRALFEENPFILSVERLADDLSRLARQRWSVFDETDGLRSIVHEVDRIDRALSEPSLYWAFQERFALGPEFDRVLELMRGSRFLRSELTPDLDLASEARRQGEVRWRLLQRNLYEYHGSGLTGLLFKREGGGVAMQLSGDVEVLKTTLDDFLSQSFMEEVDPNRRQASLADRADFGRRRLRWDTSVLVYAVDLHKPYQRFLDSGLAFFPDQLRQTLKIVAQRRLEATLLDLLQRAQILEPVPADLPLTLRERDLKGEIDRFKEASEPLGRLLTVMQDAQLWESEKALNELLAAQSHELLRAVDGVLGSEPLYRPSGGSFRWWDPPAPEAAPKPKEAAGKEAPARPGSQGEVRPAVRPLAFQAFDVADAKELETHLASQRERVRELATQFAQPLVEMPPTAVTDEQRALRGRWRGILDQLKGFDEKHPGNSVATLDKLITTQLTEVGMSNCFETARPFDGGTTGDYFLDQESFLRGRLYERCYELVGERAASGYRKLEKFFNQRLAGKFPFAGAVEEFYPVEADPQTVREFFRLFEVERSIIEAAPRGHPGFAGADEEIHRFIEDVSEIGEFLSAFIKEAGPLAQPVLDFEVEFRVNRELESCGQHIIEWKLVTGEREVIHPDPDPIVRWTYGSPVKLVLRWAANSLWTPIENQERPGVEVNQKTVTFENRNRWALISFVQAYPSASTDFLTLRDERPHTLKLQLKTRREGAAASPQPAVDEQCSGDAKVFVRIGLIASQTKEPMTLPDFPHQAPRLAERSPADRVGGQK